MLYARFSFSASPLYLRLTSTVAYASPTRPKVAPVANITLPVLASAGQGLSLSTTGTSPQLDAIPPIKLPIGKSYVYCQLSS